MGRVLADADRVGSRQGSFVSRRPFHTRWLYWEADGSPLDRPRPDYRPQTDRGRDGFSVGPAESITDIRFGEVAVNARPF